MKVKEEGLTVIDESEELIICQIESIKTKKE